MISYSSFLRIDPLFGIAPLFIDFFLHLSSFPTLLILEKYYRPLTREKVETNVI